MLTPLTLCVISRILRLNRSRDFGAILRLMSGPVVKLNPRNFRSCGRATALKERASAQVASYRFVWVRSSPNCAYILGRWLEARHDPIEAFALDVRVRKIRIHEHG